MARKSATKKTSKKKSTKVYPVVRRTALASDGVADPNACIRVDKVLSGRNHRLYRQSRVYSVKVDLDINAAAGQTVDIYALGHSWMAQKAYQFAYKQFMENSKEERSQLGNHVARWNDFRVDHGISAFALNLAAAGATPGSSGLTKFGNGTEYIMSEVADAAGATKKFYWTGAGSSSSFNIIDEYDVTGNANATPHVAASAVGYDGLSDEVDSNQVDHLSGHGNLPPYDAQNMENAVWVKIATLSVNAAGQQKLSTGFFEAPAGLILVQSSAPLANDSSVLNLECKAGDYKGVHAPSMLE